jgi:dienelactone hydrolase
MRLAVEWARADKDTCRLRIGLFGASTGAAAAALCAAADLQGQISALVSRGGRPDLAGEALPLVSAPTLLIVGGADTDVIELDEMALARMTCQRELKIVPGATHLFEEKGTLDQAVRLATDWYDAHLPRDARWFVPGVTTAGQRI